jgi:uncharacterized protein YbjT (DUF2867 family)
MTSPNLLTGGTGNLGSLVRPLLESAGRRVRVLSRSAAPSASAHPQVAHVVGDLNSGVGIDQAVAGVETIVHCAGAATGDGARAQTLVEAARRAGVTHLVHISVVGADRVVVCSRIDEAIFGYFRSKREAEEAVMGSGVPWTILRATQFHDLTLTTASAMARLPIVPVPSKISFQPVDSGEVASRLAELALGEPAGLVPDIAGPRVYRMEELVRSYLRATGKRRILVPVRLPGRGAASLRAGVNLSPDRPLGRLTWEDFLERHTAPADA